jgi:kynurenine formamidase
VPDRSAWRVVDLTQPLGPRTVLWPGSRPFAAEAEGRMDRDGWYSRSLAVPEHAGTHLDAPAHFAADGASVEAIPVERLVCPAVVLDAAEACARDPDHGVGPEVLEAHEAAHGAVPEGAAVLVRTGWDRFLADPDRYLGPAGRLRFPGLAAGTARRLVDRGVGGIGIDTLSVDRGSDDGTPVHRITLPAGLWHLEGLVALERLPPRGAWVVVGVIPVVEGSGAPARVIALVPAGAVDTPVRSAGSSRSTPRPRGSADP